MENFEILEPDEIVRAINKLIFQKEAAIRELKWKEEISKPVVYQEITAKMLFDKVYKDGVAKIKESDPKKEFKLSKDELHVYKLLSLYFTGDERFEAEYGYSLRKGIMLCGDVGCGKTTALELFQINPFQSYIMTPCRTVSYEFTKQKDKNTGYAIIEKFFENIPVVGSQKYFGQKILGRCFDDLGTENIAKSFGNESNVMCEVILNRYDLELPEGFRTHISTNLNADQIEEMYGVRVRSRMKDMFNQIIYPAGDKRG